MSFWIIQDFPDTARFLSEEERTLVVRRLQGDDQFSAAGEKLRMKYIWQSLLDWKTWLASMCLIFLILWILKSASSVIIYMGCDGPLYAFSLFLPSIINQVCRSVYRLLNIPLKVCSLVCCDNLSDFSRVQTFSTRLQGNSCKPFNGTSLCVCRNNNLYGGLFG